MQFERIDVKTRDSYRVSQEPVVFDWRHRSYWVERVIDRWYEGRVDSTRLPMLYFRVATGEGEIFILRYHEWFRSWSLMVPEGSR